MRNRISIPGLLLLFTILSCQKVIFIPVQGSIEGIVTDNNGAPLSGIQVSAAYKAASTGGQATPGLQTATTDEEGYYRLHELWDEVALSINQPGFSPFFKLVDLEKAAHSKVDIRLEGSPGILAVTPSKTVLSAGIQDTLLVHIEGQDRFNSQTGNYSGSLLLQNADGDTQAIVSTSTAGMSQERFLLQALVTSDLLPMGSYQLVVEVRDPDENAYRQTTEQSIRVE